MLTGGAAGHAHELAEAAGSGVTTGGAVGHAHELAEAAGGAASLASLSNSTAVACANNEDSAATSATAIGGLAMGLHAPGYHVKSDLCLICIAFTYQVILITLFIVLYRKGYTRFICICITGYAGY